MDEGLIRGDHSASHSATPFGDSQNNSKAIGMTTKKKADGNRRQRVRSPHRGVKLKFRNIRGYEVWIARWRDPFTSKFKEVSLTGLGRTTAESRREWAMNKSNELVAQRAALASGSAIVTRTPVTKAVKLMVRAREQELKPSTLRVYEEATRPFGQWAKRAGLDYIEDLTPPKLTAFRDWFLPRKKRVNASGEGVGRKKRVLGEGKRSPAQVNKIIRTLRTILSFWRKRGLTPNLTSDTIRDALEFVKAPRPLPQFLRSAAIVQLLEAAQRHDMATFSFVRRGEARLGSQHHYPPIFPFVAAALLTGMRFSELANLKWSDVDLDALEIRLEHTATKTGHGRSVGLRETPALGALLRRMKVQRDGKVYVFGSKETAGNNKVVQNPMTREIADAARKRLIGEFDAPAFTWQDLRRTCGTFLTCAPAIYGAASAFLSAKRLGHSVVVAERYYAGALTNIGADCDTIEKAMGCGPLLPQPEADELNSFSQHSG